MRMRVTQGKKTGSVIAIAENTDGDKYLKVEFDGVRREFLHAQADLELEKVDLETNKMASSAKDRTESDSWLEQLDDKLKMLPSRPGVWYNYDGSGPFDLKEIEFPSRGWLDVQHKREEALLKKVEALLQMHRATLLVDENLAAKQAILEEYDRAFTKLKTEKSKSSQKITSSLQFKLLERIPPRLHGLAPVVKLKRDVVLKSAANKAARRTSRAKRVVVESPLEDRAAEPVISSAGVSRGAANGASRTSKGLQRSSNISSGLNEQRITASLGRDGSGSKPKVIKSRVPQVKAAPHLATLSHESTECSEFTEVGEDSADELNASDASDASGRSEIQTDISELTENSEASSDEMDEPWDGALGVA